MFLPISCPDDQYHHILELNNLSVDLTEAGAFQSSASALREAIQIIKHVAQPGKGNLRSFSRYKVVMFECTKQLLETRYLHPLDLGANMHSLGIPIRLIEAQAEAVTTDGLRNNETITAALLYNFGLLNRWAGNGLDDRSYGQYNVSALKLFKASHAVLMNCKTLSDEDGDIGDVRLCLLLKVLTVLCDILAELGKHVEASLHRQELLYAGREAYFKIIFGNAIREPCAGAA